MDKKFQIFVSSTYQDLEEERRAVIEAILDLGHIPIGMESFQASNEEQWSYIQKRIDEADYYVVIVAERYGSTNTEGVSYTEMEYDYAREKGVPVAAFLLHESARPDWRRNKADALDNRAKVDGFRQKCSGFMVQFWKNKYELASACVKSLSQMFNAFPRDGWIPAKTAMRPEVANELARLSKENDELKQLCASLEQPQQTAKSLITQLDNQTVLEFSYSVINRINSEGNHSITIRPGEEKLINSMKKVFAAVGIYAISGCIYYPIHESVSNFTPKIDDSGMDYMKTTYAEVLCAEIIDHFMAMGLMDFTVEARMRRDRQYTEKRFFLTALGKETFSAIRSENPEMIPIVTNKYMS